MPYAALASLSRYAMPPLAIVVIIADSRRGMISIWPMRNNMVAWKMPACGDGRRANDQNEEASSARGDEEGFGTARACWCRCGGVAAFAAADYLRLHQASQHAAISQRLLGAR